jgi:hypothetical protein
MLKSIFQSLGIVRNLERMKSELEQEANIQIKSARTITGHLAAISAWVTVSAFIAVLSVIVGICWIFAWLAASYGATTALGILFVLLLSLSIIGALIARSKYAQIPSRPSIKLPRIVDPSVSNRDMANSPVASRESEQRSYASPTSSSIVADPLFDWLYSVAREAAPSGNTGSSHVDQLFNTLKPRAEAVAGEAMTMAIQQLRSGDRKTMLAILGAGVFVGWLASRRRHSNRH